MPSRTRRGVQVHQVLATLGYGDAIGHEALGIQEVLRHAGYDSRIYVQTADQELEHLTEDYRDLVDDSHPENILIHHFSIGSRASRVAFALPERMVLVYHNITPPSYFIGVNKALVELCYIGRRELQRVQVAVRSCSWETRSSIDTSSSSMGFPHTGVLSVVPNFNHLDVSPDRLLAAGFDDDWTNILFVGRMIPNKRIEDLIRFFHAYRLKYNPASRLILVGAHSGFKDYVASLYEMLATTGDTRRAPDWTRVKRGTDGAL